MPEPPQTVLRRATTADIEALEDHVQAGFDTYAAFAPAGWRPPRVREVREDTLALLADARTWAVLALRDGSPAGHVSFLPGRRRDAEQDGGDWRERPLEPGLAHLWQLFVLPAWWGRGVAAQLHDAALEEMRRRDYERARLYTPSGHLRARRFYERRGWEPVDERHHPFFDLPLTEYHLDLG